MLRTDGRTQGHMDARTDGQRENSIPTTNKVCGGIITAVLWALIVRSGQHELAAHTVSLY